MTTLAAQPARTVPEHVMRAAKRMFLANGMVEMRALARDVGIGRATLYRWNWSRDDLLQAVIAALGLANLARAEHDVSTPPGAERFCDVHDLHIRRICASTGMRSFIRSEPEVAARLLLDAGGRVHLSLVDGLADLIRRQQEEGGWQPPLPAERLAGLVARLTEAFMYGDLFARAEPDPDTPDLVLRMMLDVATRS